MGSHVVFCYGTLKRGRGNHGLLANAEFLGEAITKPEFTMYNLGWFPGVRKVGNTAIHGEIYRVNEQEFAALDRLEGYPSLYVREQIDIKGRTETPWIYIINRDMLDSHTVVEGGVW